MTTAAKVIVDRLAAMHHAGGVRYAGRVRTLMSASCRPAEKRTTGGRDASEFLLTNKETADGVPIYVVGDTRENNNRTPPPSRPCTILPRLGITLQGAHFVTGPSINSHPRCNTRRHDVKR